MRIVGHIWYGLCQKGVPVDRIVAPLPYVDTGTIQCTFSVYTSGRVKTTRGQKWIPQPQTRGIPCLHPLGGASDAVRAPCARRVNSWPNTIDHRGRSDEADTLLTPLGAHSSWLLWGRSRSASFLRGHQNIGRRAARRARAVRMSPLWPPQRHEMSGPKGAHGDRCSDHQIRCHTKRSQSIHRRERIASGELSPLAEGARHRFPRAS